MLTKNDAVTKAEAYLEAITKGTPKAGKTMLWDEKTREVPQGWLFFWQTIEFLDTHDPAMALLGGGPVLVDRQDGSVHLLRPIRIEQQLEAYSAERKWVREVRD